MTVVSNLLAGALPGGMRGGVLKRTSAGIRSASGVDPLSMLPASSALPNTILLRKLRTDYPEFCVYTPISADGINWCRWLFTNRYNSGNTAATRMIRATLSRLFSSAAQSPHGDNIATETSFPTPLSAQTTADATTRSGTWTASATVGGMTDIRYSTVDGDYVEYQVTGVSRIAFRHYSTSNAAIVAVYITDGAAEISAAQYTMTGLLDLNQPPGKYRTPIAQGLDPAKTYTVRLTRDASSTAGYRLYDGGVLGYAAAAFDEVGYYGPAYIQSLGSPAVNTCALRFPGSLAVYEVTASNRVAWRYVSNTVGGKSYCTVYDSTGTEIDSARYVSRTIDTYGAASVEFTTTIADGLPAGTYYLHILVLNDKNASSTGYRAYDYGAVGYDTTAAGVVGTDAFDDGSVSDSDMASGDRTFIGTGNLELAIRCRKTTEAYGDPGDAFVGGTHGHESDPASLVFSIDSSVIDFAAGTAGDEWTGASLNITFTTTLKFAADASTFASASYDYTLDRSGYLVSDSVTTSADAYIDVDYSMMLNAPDVGPDGYYGGCNGIAYVSASEQKYMGPTNKDDGTYDMAQKADMFSAFNDRYIATAQQLNWSAIDAAVSAYDDGGVRTIGQDRSDNYTKAYNRAFSGVYTGTLVTAGYARTSQKRYRVALL